MLLPAVCGKIVFTFCLLIIFNPVATEVERDKLASSEFSVKERKKIIRHTEINAISNLRGKKIKENSSAHGGRRLCT